MKILIVLSGDDIYRRLLNNMLLGWLCTAGIHMVIANWIIGVVVF